jgi:hypothetical protein
MPDQDAVIVFTAETPDMQDEINLVWKYLLPAIHPNKLPADFSMDVTLKQKLASLALSVPVKGMASPLQAQITDKVFKVEKNEKNIASIGFQFKDDLCSVVLKTDTADYKLGFGWGTWKTGETKRHGPYLVANAKGNLTGLPPFKIAGAYTWKDEHTLVLTLRYIESPHTETLICHFDQNEISVDMQNSMKHGVSNLVLKGKLSQ